MNAVQALAAYREASAKAWKTFIAYRDGRATDAQVHIANKAEANALVDLEMAIDALAS